MSGSLLQKLERAYLLLLEEVSPEEEPLPPEGEEGSVDPLGVSGPHDDMAFADRVRLLNSATQFLAIKHRVAPEEEDSGLDNLVADYKASRATRRRRSPNGSA